MPGIFFLINTDLTNGLESIRWLARTMPFSAAFTRMYIMLEVSRFMFTLEVPGHQLSPPNISQRPMDLNARRKSPGDSVGKGHLSALRAHQRHLFIRKPTWMAFGQTLHVDLMPPEWAKRRRKRRKGSQTQEFYK